LQIVLPGRYFSIERCLQAAHVVRQGRVGGFQRGDGGGVGVRCGGQLRVHVALRTHPPCDSRRDGHGVEPVGGGRLRRGAQQLQLFPMHAGGRRRA